MRPGWCPRCRRRLSEEGANGRGTAFRCRDPLGNPLMWATPIVVTDVAAKDAFEMGFVHDQKVVEALRPDGTHEPFGNRVRIRGPKGMEEVRGHDTRRPGPQELTPGGTTSPGSGAEPVVLRDPGDGARRQAHAVAHPGCAGSPISDFPLPGARRVRLQEGQARRPWTAR